MNNYIEIDNDNFPSVLKNIKNPPKIIFFKGNINLLNTLCFAVIGSRDLTNYGKRIEKKFVRDLVFRGITIVSGMAIGADTVAHIEALENNGKTIAILGSGFNHIYPKENIELYKRIIENDGLVLTEYSPNVEPNSKNFPKRNRIISGISSGVLIIEAKHRSGTSITANYAKSQEKKVFALPGRLDSKNGVGVNRMIKEGAILVTSIFDIIDEIPEFKNLQSINIKHNTFMKKEFRKIYNVLDDEPMKIDDICFKTRNTVQATLKLLTLMELDGLVEEIIGAGYVKRYKE